MKPFLCPECGGTVDMREPNGETRDYGDGIVLIIPKHILIPKCDKCGDTYYDPSDSKRIDDSLKDRLYLARLGLI